MQFVKAIVEESLESSLKGFDVLYTGRMVIDSYPPWLVRVGKAEAPYVQYSLTSVSVSHWGPSLTLEVQTASVRLPIQY